LDLYLRNQKEKIRSISYASGGQPNINLETLNTYHFPLPPFEEQKEIVSRVDALFKLADRIEKRVTAATVRAEKLTQAIRAKAFLGELVPTDAELARREGRSYEPASVLLARIK
jgi:type I restriction enzyme, S subunit